MRLTNTIRQAFITSVLNDVPQVDYVEKARKEIMKQVAAIHKKAGILDAESGRLTCHYLHPGIATSFQVSGLLQEERAAILNSATIKELVALHNEQQTRLNDLNAKISGAIQACSSRKMAVEILPEFEKYLPADEAAACKTLPAIANVVSDFVKAGWPKDAKKPVLTAVKASRKQRLAAA